MAGLVIVIPPEEEAEVVVELVEVPEEPEPDEELEPDEVPEELEPDEEPEEPELVEDPEEPDEDPEELEPDEEPEVPELDDEPEEPVPDEELDDGGAMTGELPEAVRALVLVLPQPVPNTAAAVSRQKAREEFLNMFTGSLLKSVE